MKCPYCNGEGSVEKTVNTGDGMSPDRDVMVICHICEGKGVVMDDFYYDYDEREFDENDFVHWDEDDEQ